MGQTPSLLEVYDLEVRKRAQWTRMVREEFPNLVRHTSIEKKRGALVSWFALDEKDADLEIEHQAEYFQSLGMDLVWKVFSHDSPPDMNSKLEEHGFKLDGSDALMVIDLENAPDYFWSTQISDVIRITEPSQVDAVMQMEKEIWNRDFAQLGEGLKMDLQNFPKHLSMYAVFDENRALSAAWMYYLDPAPFAMLLGGSTLPAMRKRGYYTMLLAARAREARERRIRYLTVDASPMSRPILEKHGFLCLDESCEYELVYNHSNE